MTRTLTLTLKKKWFDMILSGEKREEFREIKEYWLTRLFNPSEYAVTDQNMIDEVIYELNNKSISLSELYDWSGWIAKRFDFICFKNGYSKNAPEMTVKCNDIRIGTGNPDWGAEDGIIYFVIQLGKIIATKNL